MKESKERMQLDVTVAFMNLTQQIAYLAEAYPEIKDGGHNDNGLTHYRTAMKGLGDFMRYFQVAVLGELSD